MGLSREGSRMALHDASPGDVVDLGPLDPELAGARTRALVKTEAARPIVGKGTEIPPHSVAGPVILDRKSTRLNPVTNAHLVCRLLLEKKKNNYQYDPSQLTTHTSTQCINRKIPRLT